MLFPVTVVLPLVLTLSQVSSEGDGTLAQINGLKGTGGTMHSSSKSKHVYKVTIQWDTSDPKYKDVNGGYCRIIKTGTRRGDASEMCIIELV